VAADVVLIDEAAAVDTRFRDQGVPGADPVEPELKPPARKMLAGRWLSPRPRPGSVTANAPTGTALAQAGAIFTASDQLVAIRDSLISGNGARSTTSTGAALVEGAGVLNAGLLELRSSEVSDNKGDATGPSGIAQGGGIWNSTIPDGPLVQLTLRGSGVTRNTLSASAGLAIQGGGGVYTTFPITLTRSLIAKNAPDNCFGC
jgi:hypothetical protein